VTESWLHSNIPNNIIHIPGYSIIRCDRPLRIGGGVCVWCKDDIYYDEFIPSCNRPEDIECVFLLLHSYKALLCFIYVPPNLKAVVFESISIYIIDVIDELLILKPDSNGLPHW